MSDHETGIPDAYRRADWRCTLPVCELQQAVGIGFDLGDREVVRLRLPVSSAKALVASLTAYLDAHDARCQAPTSVGIPSDDKSAPHEGVKV
jgi:hypothetical protein